MDIKTFFKFGREDFSKESFLYFVLALVFIVIALGALTFYLFCVFRGVAESPKITEKSLEERLIESTTAPDIGASIETKVQKSLSASSSDKEVSEEVLNSLSAPNNKK